MQLRQGRASEGPRVGIGGAAQGLDQWVLVHLAGGRQQVGDDGADADAAVAQPYQARFVDPAVLDRDDLAVAVQVVARAVLFGHAGAVQRDDLPFVVEDRRAAAAGRGIALVDQDVGQAVVDDLVVAQRHLFFAAVGVLHDGGVVAGAGLAECAVQHQVALLGQVALAAHVHGPHRHHGQVQRGMGMQEGLGIEGMRHGFLAAPEQVVFVAELDRRVFGEGGEFGGGGYREDMMIGDHQFRRHHEAGGVGGAPRGPVQVADAADRGCVQVARQQVIAGQQVVAADIALERQIGAFARGGGDHGATPREMLGAVQLAGGFGSIALA
ncbi:Uncharacterised protein [Achromobacter xylosoxidans]|nr:Uncharacterised protein [Achromobacter xylosoxidans]